MTAPLPEEHPLKADPVAQHKLLDIQELDSMLDTLRHRLANLPETKELAEQAAERARLDGEARDLQLRADDLGREQRKADDDVEQVKTRRSRDQQRLDSGAVANPKDLERLQHELVSLDRRIAELEDLELEVMARLEDVQHDLAQRREQHRPDRRADAGARRGAGQAGGGDPRGAGARCSDDREAAAAGFPADLMALYERLREQKGGVGAALLRARRCGGCSLEINSSELASIAKKPADEVVRCEECSRILVRTAESGL